MTANEHTPTPWEKSGNIILHKKTSTLIGGIQKEEDAKFIVRACNQHDYLFEACRSVLGILREESEEVWEIEILTLSRALEYGGKNNGK